MHALARHFDEPVSSGTDTYLARVYAGGIESGRWGGWIVFFPVGGGPVISTDRETTQSSIAARELRRLERLGVDASADALVDGS